MLAITTGPSGLIRGDSQLEPEREIPTQEITMVLTAVDQATRRAVPDIRFDINFFSGRRPRHYGFYTTDEKGQTLVDLPPEPIKFLSIRVVSSDYEAAERTWNVAAGDHIPTNCVFQVSKFTP